MSFKLVQYDFRSMYRIVSNDIISIGGAFDWGKSIFRATNFSKVSTDMAKCFDWYCDYA